MTFQPTLEVISLFTESFFDFVYIDGDHSYNGAKSDLIHFFPKVRTGGLIAGHDYCCNEKEHRSTLHAPWCGRYIFPHSASNPAKHGKEKSSWCGIFHGAEEFAKEHNFYWMYTLEGRYGNDHAGLDNPSYFTMKFDAEQYTSWSGDRMSVNHTRASKSPVRERTNDE